MTATLLTPTLTVAGQPLAGDFATLAQAGFRLVVSNRPDGEEAGQLPAVEAATIASALGLDYRHIPVTFASLSSADIAAFGEAIEAAGGKVFAHCRSGARSSTLWALNEVTRGRMTADDAIAALQARGLDASPTQKWLDVQENLESPTISG